MYERIHGKQKTRKKKAAIALACKLVVVAWGMLRNKTDWDPAIMAKVTSSYKGSDPRVETAQNASSVSAPKEETLTELPERVERVVASKPKERSSRATSSLTGQVKTPGRKVVIDAAEAKVRKPSRRAVAT